MSVCTFMASNGPLTAVDDRAEQILRYIKAALKETEVVEFWYVWLMDYHHFIA